MKIKLLRLDGQTDCKTSLQTDLWTRVIHLLQIELSRSAETPNSFKDLNDMLWNYTPVTFRQKSRSTSVSISRYLPAVSTYYWRHVNKKALKTKIKLPKRGARSPPAGTFIKTALQSSPSLLKSLVSAHRFCSISPPRGACDGTDGNLQLLRHSRGTITYCSPMLENTIHRSSTAQWANSEGCFGTHRRLRLLGPLRWCVTPFIQFCLWHYAAILLRALWWNLAFWYSDASCALTCV